MTEHLGSEARYRVQADRQIPKRGQVQDGTPGGIGRAPGPGRDIRTGDREEALAPADLGSTRRCSRSAPRGSSRFLANDPAEKGCSRCRPGGPAGCEPGSSSHCGGRGHRGVRRFGAGGGDAGDVSGPRWASTRRRSSTSTGCFEQVRGQAVGGKAPRWARWRGRGTPTPLALSDWRHPCSFAKGVDPWACRPACHRTRGCSIAEATAASRNRVAGRVQPRGGSAHRGTAWAHPDVLGRPPSPPGRAAEGGGAFRTPLSPIPRTGW